MFWSSSLLLLHSSMMQFMLLIGKWEKNGTLVTIQPPLWPSADQPLSSVLNASTLQRWWPISRPRNVPPVQMGKPNVTVVDGEVGRNTAPGTVDSLAKLTHNCVPTACSDATSYCREGDQREKDGENNSTLRPTAFRSYSWKLHPTRVQLAHIMKRSDVLPSPSIAPQFLLHMSITAFKLFVVVVCVFSGTPFNQPASEWLPESRWTGPQEPTWWDQRVSVVAPAHNGCCLISRAKLTFPAFPHFTFLCNTRICQPSSKHAQGPMMHHFWQQS